jgi:hypothetical protein
MLKERGLKKKFQNQDKKKYPYRFVIIAIPIKPSFGNFKK